MIDPEKVAAVLVTRGDVDVDEILASAPFQGETSVWDNSVEQDLAVYGRYAAIERTSAPVVFVQDDDCVLPPDSWRALLDAYTPGTVTCVMSAWHQEHHREEALVGFGAVFDRDLPRLAFERFGLALRSRIDLGDYSDAVFLRTCDVVFTALTPFRAIDVRYDYLPWSSTPGRMWKQPGFAVERERVLDLALAAR